MIWVFQKYNLEYLINYKKIEQIGIIEYTEQYLKKYLDAFKYCPVGKNVQREYSRKKAEFYLVKLEKLIEKNKFLYCSNPMLSDYAILPFIRQCFYSDISYSKNQKFSNLYEWMEKIIHLDLFLKVMQKN